MLLKRASASFEAEDDTARLSRRKNNWIPDVEFIDRSNGQPL